MFKFALAGFKFGDAVWQRFKFSLVAEREPFGAGGGRG
jgi:hypothetical protein